MNKWSTEETEMETHTKFLFEKEFEKPSQAHGKKNLTFTTEDISKAHAEGIKEGKAKAEAEAETNIEQKLNQLITMIQGLTTRMNNTQDQIAKNAVEIAFTAAEMLSERLISQQSGEILISMFEECIHHLPRISHLAVYIPKPRTEDKNLRTLLENIAEKKGWKGQFLLLTDLDMKPGDCRIEWDQGKIIRDRKKLSEKLQEIITTHFPDTNKKTIESKNQSQTE
ncbi:MAG: FliH/SctL family protein [Alphaproteobacteria bacterium]|nr:FliH/SctL family protein [Alphaproteobacteria bacterium]